MAKCAGEPKVRREGCEAAARFARAEGVGLPEREARTRRAVRGRAALKGPRRSFALSAETIAEL